MQSVIRLYRNLLSVPFLGHRTGKSRSILVLHISNLPMRSSANFGAVWLSLRRARKLLGPILSISVSKESRHFSVLLGNIKLYLV